MKKDKEELMVWGDLFAGAGGTTTGALAVQGVKVAWALNHSKEAIYTHELNHPETVHYHADIKDMDEHKLTRVDGLWASLECFPAGTLILTSKGLIPIEDIFINDLVLTHKGRWMPVTSIFNRKSDTVVLKGQGHPGIEVTKNHPFYVRKQKRVWNNSIRRWNYKQIGEPQWLISSDLKDDKYRWATPIKADILNIPAVKGRGMDLEDPNFWWMVGRWLGDGLSSPKRGGQISIVCGNHEVDELVNKLDCFSPKKEKAEKHELNWQYRELRTASIFYCSHLHLSNWLIENFGRLSYGKTIPAWALTMSNEYKEALLNGYVSADGHKEPNRTQTTSVSKNLALGIRLLAESLGYRCSLHKYKQHNHIIEGRNVSGRDVWIVAWDNNQSSRNAFEEGLHSWSSIKSIVNGSENIQVYNISVHEDESYIADGIVVHNCTNFSNAKGGLPREGDSRTLAWELVRYIVWCKPKYIIIENVREFLSWGPLDANGKPVSRDKGKDFIKWVNFIKNLGYENYDKAILNSADFGAYTARKRLFLIFSNVGCEISFPKPLLDKKHYKACKEKINLGNTGESIFGRKKPLAEKTLQRIAAGIRKFYPEMAHVMQYYGNGYNGQSITKPLNTITTKERHALIQFGVEYNGDSDAFSVDKPLRAITTKQKHAIASIEDKQFITKFYTGNIKSQNSSIEKPLHSITGSNHHALTTVKNDQFITEYYGRDTAINSIDDPLRTITTASRHALTTLEKKQFVSDHIWGSDNQPIDKPLSTICTKESKQLITVDDSEDFDKEEKYQFITKYFSGVPWQKNDSIDSPLSTITTVNRHALATLLMNGSFDIRLRFLTPKELADITGFPEDYQWYGSNKFKTWMIGNAVPILLAKVIIHETKKNYDTRRCETTFQRDDKTLGTNTRGTDKLFDRPNLFSETKRI